MLGDSLVRTSQREVTTTLQRLPLLRAALPLMACAAAAGVAGALPELPRACGLLWASRLTPGVFHVLSALEESRWRSRPARASACGSPANLAAAGAAGGADVGGGGGLAVDPGCAASFVCVVSASAAWLASMERTAAGLPVHGDTRPLHCRRCRRRRRPGAGGSHPGQVQRLLA